MTHDLERVPEAFDNIPPYDKRTGAHYWVIVAAFFMDNPYEVVMSVDSLVAITPGVCRYCELPYSVTNKTRRCPGPYRSATTIHL